MDPDLMQLGLEGKEKWQHIQDILTNSALLRTPFRTPPAPTMRQLAINGL
jgi:hypothetical protein